MIDTPYAYGKMADYNGDIKTHYNVNWHRPRLSITDNIQKSNSNF